MKREPFNPEPVRDEQPAEVAGVSPELDRVATEVIGAAIEVHRHLGPGFNEAVYEEALAVEFALRGIPAIRQALVEVRYKNNRVGEGRLDFLVAERLIVELKSVDALALVHTAQVLSYLRTTGLRLGLLINFNTKLLKHGVRRIIL